METQVIYSSKKQKMDNVSNPISCCPEISREQTCNIIDFQYRLQHNPLVTAGNRTARVPVEVILNARLEICQGPFTLGNLAYSTTLFPGERVRLFTLDRRSRFTFDSETKVSYRQEQTYEEQFYLSAMSDYMSNIESSDRASSSSNSSGSASTRASTSGALESIFGSPSVNVRGEYNASSTRDFLRELNVHVQSSHNRSVESTRTVNATSVGEVQSRTHAEGETEDHFESSSRLFRNPNQCRAITYYFYQINKTITVKFTIESIRKRVIDNRADTKVANRPFVSDGDISVIPQAILATDAKRLDLERNARVAVLAKEQENPANNLAIAASQFQTANVAALNRAPVFTTIGGVELTDELKTAALQQVDVDLREQGLTTDNGNLAEELRQSLSFERVTSLPTPGLLVKGCLDDCDVCEPELKRSIRLDLERKELENKLLERQIELLEQSQEYRCCPSETEEEEETEG